jgi:transglutaminase-like putative cysteine protease
LARGSEAFRLPLRALFAYTVAAALLTVAWSRLQATDVALGDVALMLALGLVPMLALAFGARRLLVVGVTLLATIVAAAIAFGISPLEARPGSGHDFFGPVLGSVRDGFQSFYESTLPFDPLDYPAMQGLVLLAIFGFSAAIGVLALLGRTMAAAVALLVGLGWAATLVPGERPLVTGALTLGGMLLYLALARVELRSWRSLVPTVAAGAVLVLAAVGASTSQAVSKGAFLGWEAWDLYDPPDRPVSVQYVWSARYGGIEFPEKKTTVLKVNVDGPRRALYWRATTLDEYNGAAWLETTNLGDVQEPQDSIDVAAGDPLLPEGATSGRGLVKQEITVEALRDNHLIGAAQPVRWEPGTSLSYQRSPGGGVVLTGSLRQDQKYSVWSYVPRSAASELAGAGTDYPADLPRRYLEPLQGVAVPAFGSPGRDGVMQSFFADAGSDTFLAANAELYELARRVTGEARTPYAAALVLEAWFRNPAAGGFTYDQQPPPAPSVNYPPLLDFVLTTRRGYCQHFAGAMTLMLRFLGIPARVAAGFTSGKYDEESRTWTVTDHNAHAWVEVFFPGHGWLPFDPTPGRGTLDAPYSYASTPGTSLSEKAEDLALVLGAAGGARLGPDGVSASQRTGRELEVVGQNPRRDAGAGVTPTADPGGNGVDTSLLALLALILAGGASAVLLVKVVRRRIRFATRDPRGIAAACRADLVGFLRDNGSEPPPSATATELRELVEETFAVDAGPYVENLTLARFGPLSGAPMAARRARRELGRLRRDMWRQLSWGRRIRTALSLRSLAG